MVYCPLLIFHAFFLFDGVNWLSGPASCSSGSRMYVLRGESEKGLSASLMYTYTFFALTPQYVDEALETVVTVIYKDY